MGKKDAYWARVEKGEDPNSYAMRQLWKEVRAAEIPGEKRNVVRVTDFDKVEPKSLR